MSGAEQLVGSTLDDRYQISSLMGEGGMGQVYEGYHVALDRKVAVKVLHPRLAHDERFRERFLREARSASKIRHPNVVQILDFGHTPADSVYFVMEFLDGRDLRSVVRGNGPLPWPRARHILRQAVGALRAAHARGIIHRDIKPANCFMCDLPEQQLTDVVKLLDFGIAKVVAADENDDDSLTGTGEVFGTATYMAPEQAHGLALDARSDVYSLGIMAYEMLVGRVPFTGANPIHVITRHLNDPPQPPRTLVPSIPPAAESLVLKAIAKRPEDRFASMADFEAALLAIPEHPELAFHGTATAALVTPVGSADVHTDVAARVGTADPRAAEAHRTQRVVSGSGPSPTGSPSAPLPANRTHPPPNEVDIATTPHAGAPYGPSASINHPDAITAVQGMDTGTGAAVVPQRSSSRALPIVLGSVVLAALLGAGAFIMASERGPEATTAAAAAPSAVVDGVASGAEDEPSTPEPPDLPPAPASDAPADPTGADQPLVDEAPREVVTTTTSANSAIEPEPETPTPLDEAEPPARTQSKTPSPKPRKKTDASVKSQLQRRIKKKCGAGHGGVRVGVELTVGSSGAILVKIVDTPGPLKGCVNGILGSARFPEGSVRKLELSVTL